MVPRNMTPHGGGQKVALPHGVLLVLAAGALATLMAAVPYTVFDLERHAIPKELALVTAGGLVAWRLLRRASVVSLGWPELALAAYAVWTVASLVTAERWWPGLRASGITLGGLAVFAGAAAVARAGRGRVLLGMLMLATALAVSTALAQAHGADSALLSRARAPGGLFGNRNFMAHAAAAGIALLVPIVLRARRGGAGAALVIAAILASGVMLSRSRAAWLAAAAGAAVLLTAASIAGELNRGASGRRRLGALAVALVAGMACAVVVPNELRWRADAPYLESLRGVADYRSGSGRGRLVQYRYTLEMARSAPVLGVGPGNWPVAYPRFTRAGDPAFAAGQPVPTNPWPSSDWAGIAAERGFPGLALLLLAGLLFAIRALSRLRAEPDTRAAAIGALVLLTVALVVGCFDAQLLLAAPSFLILGGLGAMLPADGAVLQRSIGDRARRLGASALLILTLLLAGRLVLELAAMHLYQQGGESRELAARVDPGNYRIRALLARDAARAGRCADARRWAAAAAARMPHTPYVKALPCTTSR